MDKLILVLVIGIVICILLIIVFSISDAIKARKDKKLVELNTKPVTESIQQNLEEVLNQADDPTEVLCNKTTDKESISGSEVVDQEEIKEATEQKEEQKIENDVKVATFAKEIPTINLNSSVKRRTNPPIRKAEEPTESNDNTAVGFLRSTGFAEEYKQLLETIAIELQKKANSSGDFIINYLNNNCKDIVFKGDAFVLRNEEIICNGVLLEDSDKFALNTGDRITIRFCVNFTIPEGYDIQVVAKTLKLQEMGLVLKNVVNARDDSTSIRAVLGVNRPCIIRKDDELFRVKVIKEVVI